MREEPIGHKKMVMFNNEELNSAYEQILKLNNMCDTLFAVFRKVNGGV